jgi:hypothetical protein
LGDAALDSGWNDWVDDMLQADLDHPYMVQMIEVEEPDDDQFTDYNPNPHWLKGEKGHFTGSQSEENKPATIDDINAAADKVAADMNYPRSLITASSAKKRIGIGGVEASLLGEASRNDGTIRIYAVPNQTKRGVAGTLAHEIEHQHYNAYQAALADEGEKMSPEVMNAPGKLPPEVAKDFPLMAEREEVSLKTLATQDGVSPYSRMHWDEAYDMSGGDLRNDQVMTAVHETLAEIARLEQEGKHDPATPEWMKFYHMVNRVYGDLRKTALATGKTPSGAKHLAIP